MANDLSIEYAHIYTNNRIGDEQKLSLEVLGKICNQHKDEKISLVVLVDDYSFPDPSFDYPAFVTWLGEKGFNPNAVIRESQLIPACDTVLDLMEDTVLKEQLCEYVRSKKYPCSLFIAAWYLLRLGKIEHQAVGKELIANRLVNILPRGFAPFEDKAFEIIKTTRYADVVHAIENSYFEGRLVV